MIEFREFISSRGRSMHSVGFEGKGVVGSV